MPKKGAIFNQVETNRPRSNTFNLTHDKKLTCDMGKLIPIMCMDVVPGDSISIKPSAMVRMAPMIAPVMHRANVYMHYFFVPNRIIWPEKDGNNGFENFITGGEDGLDNTVWAHADYDPATSNKGFLVDYMGLPVSTDVSGLGGIPFKVSTLPFAAYNKIYNDYYRDQNLIDKIPDTVPDGTMAPADWTALLFLKERAWQHDYFTSALPWTQKGPEAMLPLQGLAPLTHDPEFPTWATILTPLIPGDLDPININGPTEESPEVWRALIGSGAAGSNTAIDVTDNTWADLSGATLTSINDLRRAFKLQEWLERNARGGSRYNESIAVHFGVHSSDQRLNRPEFIGGVKTPIKISEVLQTSAGASDVQTFDSPQGNMAGHGISVGGGSNFRYTSEEHGYIIGIMSVMPESAYSQGVPKHFTREDKFDYYWPEFANIGEQPVLNKEIIISDSEEYNDGVFGYVPRYAEYKYQSNTIHGDFKTSLDFWHMARKFENEVNLNEDFINMDKSEVDRIFAVQGNTHHLWCQVLNEVYAKRLMPVFGTPKIN